MNFSSIVKLKMAKKMHLEVWLFLSFEFPAKRISKEQNFFHFRWHFFKFVNGICCPFKFCHNRKYHYRLKSFGDLEAQKKEELKLTFDKSYSKQKKKVFPEFCCRYSRKKNFKKMGCLWGQAGIKRGFGSSTPAWEIQ